MFRPITFFLVNVGLLLSGCAPLSPSQETATAPPQPTAAPTRALTATPTVAFTPTATETFSPPSPSPTPAAASALLLDTGLPPDEIDGLAISEDGRILALLHRGETVKVWNLETGTLLYDLPVQGGEAGALFLSPNGRYLAVWVWDGSGGSIISAYRVEDGARLQSTAWEGERPSLRFSPEGETLALGVPEAGWPAQSIHLFRTRDGAPLATIADDEALHIAAAAFSPDGQTLATGALPRLIRIWRVSDGALLRSIEAHLDEVVSLAFSPDGVYLASKSWSFDPNTYIWRVSDGTLAHTLDEENWDPTRVFFSPDGKLVALIAVEGVKIWRTDNWAFLGVAPATGGFEDLAGYTFSPDGKYLFDRAAGLLWPLPDTPFDELQPVQVEGDALALSADGVVVTADERGGTLRLWRTFILVENGRQRK